MKSVPRRAADFLTASGKRGTLSLRGRDAKGRFCKASSRRALQVELREGAKTVRTFKPMETRERAAKRSLPRSLRGALAVLAPGARAYTVKGQKIVSTLPREVLERQLSRTPNLVRFVYVKDGRRQSFIVTARRGWKSIHGSKRIKAFGKDWEKSLASWQADFMKRFQKSAPESRIQVVGFEPIWSELE